MLLQCYHGKYRRLDLSESQQIGRGQRISLDYQALVECDVDGELLVAPSSQLSADGVADCSKADWCVESGDAMDIEAEEIVGLVAKDIDPVENGSSNKIFADPLTPSARRA